MAYGTNSTLDLVASNPTLQTVAQVGEDNIWNAVQAEIAAHNNQVNQMMAEFVDRTTDQLRMYGGVQTMSMDPVDQYGTPDAQKIAAGANVGFPLRNYGASLQWTRKYFQNATVAEINAQLTAARDADITRVMNEIKRAIFVPTNYTFTDVLVNNLSLPVKALVNADGAPIPPDPSGNTFNAATHTHYLATGTFAAADLTNLVNTVVEHFGQGNVRVYINQAQEATVRGFSGFVAYVDSRVRQPDTATFAIGNLDLFNQYNRAIGLFGAAEVWVKPWIPAGYLFAWVAGQPVPLVMRERRAGSGDFGLEYDDELHPLRARGFSREFGVGVWNRVNGAVLYTGGASYTAPVIP